MSLLECSTLTIEVAKRTDQEGNIKGSIQIQGNSSREEMGKDGTGVNVAMFGFNSPRGIEMVYSPDLQTGKNDCLPYFTSTLSRQSKVQRIRVKGYFT